MMEDPNLQNDPNKKIADPCPTYMDMAERWPLIDDLVGGTVAMRKARERWLPREEKEKDKSYDNRIQRSILFNGYSDTIRRIKSKPFSKPIKITGEEDLVKIDPRLKELKKDVDGQGTNITNFAKEILGIGLNRGLVHVLVDYPSLEPGLSLADERAINPKPRFIPIDPKDMLWWKFSKSLAGQNVLEEIRIMEAVEVEDTKTGDLVEVQQIKVYGREFVTVYQEDPNTKKWFMVGAPIAHTYGEIPIFTAYLQHDGRFKSKPVLEDLAWLNLAHWQSSSDQRNILRFARCGLWLITGMDKEQVKEQGLCLGANQWFAMPDTSANMKVVEHSGASISAGRQDLIDLEERMQILGLQPFVSNRTGEQTATGKEIDEGRAVTDIQCWIRDIETLLEQCYESAKNWIVGPKRAKTVSMPEKFCIDIFSEFGLTSRGAAEIETLTSLRLSGELDRRTYWDEMRRRGLVDETLSTDEILERVENEEPSLLSLEGKDEGEVEGEEGEEGEGEDSGKNGDKEEKKGKGKDGE